MNWSKWSFVAVIILLKFDFVFSQASPTILIAYYSQSGNTKAMAEAVAKGARSLEGISLILKSIQEISQNELLFADAIILGSPVYNANLPPAVMEFINSWPYEGRPLKDKIGAVFVTGGGFSIGEEAVMLSMIRSMLIHGMLIVGGDESEAAFGASAITGEGAFAGQPVDEIFLRKAEGLGRRVGELVLK
ncbi:flavodoxin family protein [Lunatibacter salilacus]|uniref:flavodoxin family protein n=1 Tax=Lunatibacter salilacus TaxID=2483804 RepID=UPI00131ABA1E|nr:flavodoxin family protein [Lunatibacter salilacus]